MAEEKRKATSFRLSAEAKEMLEWLAARLGVSQTSVLEILLRQQVRKEKGE